MYRPISKNPRTFSAQTMDMTYEMGIIVSGTRSRSVFRDYNHISGRRLPDFFHPLTRETWPLLCSGPVAIPSWCSTGFFIALQPTGHLAAGFAPRDRANRNA
jgi:hypothetical protein